MGRHDGQFAPKVSRRRGSAVSRPLGKERAVRSGVGDQADPAHPALNARRHRVLSQSATGLGKVRARSPASRTRAKISRRHSPMLPSAEDPVFPRSVNWLHGGFLHAPRMAGTENALAASTPRLDGRFGPPASPRPIRYLSDAALQKTTAEMKVFRRGPMRVGGRWGSGRPALENLSGRKPRGSGATSMGKAVGRRLRWRVRGGRSVRGKRGVLQPWA